MTRNLFALFLCSFALSCGGATADNDAVPAPVLCDGTTSLRFAGVSGGGNANGMPRVALELGWTMLLVDGQCRYWAMAQPDGPVRTRTMSSTEAVDFVRQLALDEWAQPQTGGCADAGGTDLRFGDRRTSAGCESTAPTEAYDHWVAILFASGVDAAGPVRYSITEADNDGWVTSGQTQLASAWPLAVDPSSIAVSVSEEISAEPHDAMSQDADVLRAMRTAYLARPANANAPWLRIPVRVDGATPRYFNLAMRDVVPFERDGHLAADDFFP